MFYDCDFTSVVMTDDQEGPVKIYSEGPRECSENIHQHCVYNSLHVFSINSLCFVSTFSLWGDHFEWHIVVRRDRLIDPRTTLRGDRIQASSTLQSSSTFQGHSQLPTLRP